jgi:hypothetical protein
LVRMPLTLNRENKGIQGQNIVYCIVNDDNPLDIKIMPNLAS